MITRKIKQILLSNKLGLGGAALGNLYNPVNHFAAFKTIKAAWRSGIRSFDTAPYYGYGLSEIRLGRALQKYPRCEFVLSTKVGRLLVPDSIPKLNDPFPGALPFKPVFDYSYHGIMKSYHDSVKRLGLTPDLVLIHDLGEVTHGTQHTEMLNTFLTSGSKALEEICEKHDIAIGLGVNETQVCLDIMKKVKLDFIMLAGRYSLLEQKPLDNFFPECKKQNVGVIIAGPYNSGILSGDTNNQNFNYQPADPITQQRVTKIKEVCDQNEIELSRAAIQFPSLHPQVVSVVTGARSDKEIIKSAEQFKNPVSRFFWDTLKAKGLISPNCPPVHRR